jgi:replicative DNA helicase Mcm
MTLRDLPTAIRELQDAVRSIPEFYESVAQYHRRGYVEFDPQWCFQLEHGLEFREDLDDDPEEGIKAIEIAIKKTGVLELGPDENIDIVLRVQPERGATDLRIQELRPPHQGKLVYLEGVIKGKTSVFAQVTMLRLECHDCANILPVLVPDDKVIEDRYKCKRCKGSMRVIEKKVEPRFYVTLEETFGTSRNNELSNIPLIFKRSLAQPSIEERVGRGNVMRVAGTLQLREKKGEKNTVLQPWFVVLGVSFLRDEGQDVVVTTDAKQRLEEVKSRMSLVQYWGEELYTSIQGEKSIKEALIVQLVGNDPSLRAGKYTRGDIHQLLIGDPGSAKSTLLKLTQSYGLKTRYTSGKGASGVGITASVRKDETLGAWVVEAGVFPLSHRGVCIIDEVDKLDTDETDRLHEAMEQQQLSVDRANIHVTLPCQTSLLAAGNPDEGSFDHNKDLFSQLDFPPAFLNRFDLIWVLLDTVDEHRDSRIANTIVENLNSDNKKTEPVHLFKQYVTLAKTIKVTTPKDVSNTLTEWYTQMRKEMSKGNVKSRINARSIEALARLMTAHARAELRSEVTRADYEWATKVFMESLRYIAVDPVTGQLDFERIQTGVSRSEIKLTEVITALLQGNKQHAMTYDEIRGMVDATVSDSILVDTLRRMMKTGDLMENPKDVYRLL